MRGTEPGSPGDVTRLLRAARTGDAAALDRVIPLVYEDLRRLARAALRREGGPRTLHATALVHEAYLKLARGRTLELEDRAHFLAVAARAMRQVLVDQARRRAAARRGGGWDRTTLSTGDGALDVDADQLLALDQALNGLDHRQRQVVEMRFFAGMEEWEVAAALGISERTVRRDWVKARARLYRELYFHAGDASGSAGPPPTLS